MLKELRADFVESADSEGVRGLFRCAWRRLFLSDTTEDIIVVIRSQGLFTQLVFEREGLKLQLFGPGQQNHVESLS
jgi:hypothetical protein